MEAMLLFFYIYLALFASIALAEFHNKFYLEARYWGPLSRTQKNNKFWRLFDKHV